ncbi:MAG: hypothetical protein IPL73_05980 [Candidatus Obscuribacter sp.]|nr:hypothetical protein [Candidatus Obscuribacter sp.]
MLVACRMIIKGADGPARWSCAVPGLLGFAGYVSLSTGATGWFPLLQSRIFDFDGWRISYLEKTNIETGSLSGFHVDFLPDSVPAAPADLKDEAKSVALAATSAPQSAGGNVLIEVIEPVEGEDIAIVHEPKYR